MIILIFEGLLIARHYAFSGANNQNCEEFPKMNQESIQAVTEQVQRHSAPMRELTEEVGKVLVGLC